MGMRTSVLINLGTPRTDVPSEKGGWGKRGVCLEIQRHRQLGTNLHRGRDSSTAKRAEIGGTRVLGGDKSDWGHRNWE